MDSNRIDRLAESRIPPQATDVERGVLGCFLVEEESYYLVGHKLSEDHFYDYRNRLIFKVISELVMEDKPIDMLSVIERIEAMGNSEQVGFLYISDLSSEAYVGNVEYYAQILEEYYIRRQVILRSAQSTNEAYDTTIDAYDMVEKAEQRIFSLIESADDHEGSEIDAHIEECIVEIESNMNSGGITGIPSGITRLDEMTSGWQNGDLIVIGARPSEGKTALALNLLRTASNSAIMREENKTIAFFSLEMSNKSLIKRLITLESKVNGEKMRNGSITLDELKRIMERSANLYNKKIYIDDSDGMTISKLKNKARKIARISNLGMIIADYIGLMEGMGEQTREQTIAVISRGLKRLAKELNVPIMALSQLSRDVVKRGGSMRPMLSDLRESGAIEQDADIVLFIHRPEYHGIMTTPEGRSTMGMAELLLAKQRNGATGIVETLFIKEYGEFKNLAPEAFFEAPQGVIENEEEVEYLF